MPQPIECLSTSKNQCSKKESPAIKRGQFTTLGYNRFLPLYPGILSQAIPCCLLIPLLCVFAWHMELASNAQVVSLSKPSIVTIKFRLIAVIPVVGVPGDEHFIVVFIESGDWDSLHVLHGKSACRTCFVPRDMPTFLFMSFAATFAFILLITPSTKVSSYLSFFHVTIPLQG